MRIFQVSLPHFYQIDGRDQAAVLGQLASLFAGPLQHCRFLTFVAPASLETLARERRRITVGEVVRVVRKVETSEDPLDDAGGSPLGQKVVRPLWNELQNEVMVRLDAVTIDDLCTRANGVGIASEGRTNLDFSI